MCPKVCNGDDTGRGSGSLNFVSVDVLVAPGVSVEVDAGGGVNVIFVERHLFDGLFVTTAGT